MPRWICRRNGRSPFATHLGNKIRRARSPLRRRQHTAAVKHDVCSEKSEHRNGPGWHGMIDTEGDFEEECCLPLARNPRLASPVRLVVPGWGPVQDKHNEYVSPFLLR
jgi:hypothetical protein